MATFAEITARLRAEREIEVASSDEIAVTFERREVDGSTRRQRVMLRAYEAWGVRMLEIRSAFGRAGDYEAAALLENNLHLPLGAVAQHGQYLVLVHKTCLEGLSVEAVLFLAARVSMVADVLEARSGADRF